MRIYELANRSARPLRGCDALEAHRGYVLTSTVARRVAAFVAGPLRDVSWDLTTRGAAPRTR